MAKSKRNPRRVAGRDDLRKRVASLGLPCHICGLPIRYDLPAGLPESYELDEIVPVSKGGSPVAYENVKAAHRCCNQWRGDRPMSHVQRVRDELASRRVRWRTPRQFVEAARSLRKGGASVGSKVAIGTPERRSRDW